MNWTSPGILSVNFQFTQLINPVTLSVADFCQFENTNFAAVSK